MTAAELIAELEKLPPETLVVIARDAEGNSYSPMANSWLGSYLAETTWYGEAGFGTLEESLAAGYEEEDVIEGGVPAFFLTPTY